MLVLASASPRRRELLRFITEDFEIVTADVDETLEPGISPQDAVKALARKKAAAVAPLRPNDVVIGADTVVALNGEILGKPANKREAVEMLKRLSGKTHEAVTGVCVIKNGKSDVFACSTRVTFMEIDLRQIEDYVETGEPLDKAGAYGIQGKAALLIEKIEGDYYNVVGLPIAPLNQKLGELGVNSVYLRKNLRKNVGGG